MALARKLDCDRSRRVFVAAQPLRLAQASGKSLRTRERTTKTERPRLANYSIEDGQSASSHQIEGADPRPSEVMR